MVIPKSNKMGRTKNKISNAQIFKIEKEQREKRRAVIEKHRKSMDKIRKSPNTKRIVYEDYPEAFNYVDKLFPGSNVKNVVLYKVSPKLLEALGYGRVGGFYDRESKEIVIASYAPTYKSLSPARYNTSIQAKIKKDEIIAHELCHYCFVEEGGTSPSREIWEEFAYGWTLGYLRKKGYTDDQIIKWNYFPFLVDIMSEKALEIILFRNDISIKKYNGFSEFKRNEFWKIHGRKWHELRKELAYKRGQEMISLYERKLLEGTYCTKKVEETNRFDLIEF
jgi:hypothetical protein